MRPISEILILLVCMMGGCISEFIPETDTNREYLVVDGLITDQCESYKIKLTTSMQVGKKPEDKPVTRASVSVSDDSGNTFKFNEKKPGIYFSDSTKFRGIVGRKYTLHILTRDASFNQAVYESSPQELKPVPSIDSVYYKKVILTASDQFSDRVEACQIYLDTHDDSNRCIYYRWTYTETWEFHLHWDAPNWKCWIHARSDGIMIKNTLALTENRISTYPINFITNNSDRLQVKYSIQVNQYSLCEEEYTYWDKMKMFTESVGGLYDMIPSATKSNIFSVSDTAEPVLGWFSVSARASARIFIKNNWAGHFRYNNCRGEILYNPPSSIPGLGEYVWILESNFSSEPPYIIFTTDKSCVDCTLRGTNIKPAFWQD